VRQFRDRALPAGDVVPAVTTGLLGLLDRNGAVENEKSFAGLWKATASNQGRIQEVPTVAANVAGITSSE
jgi:hypothetical protein